MANRERGEFTLVAGDRRVVLRLTTNAGAELEDFTNGRTLAQVYAGMAKESLKDTRLFLWCALRDKHPEIATDDPVCLKDIGGIIDDAGGLDGIATQIEAFVNLNLPPKKETKPDKGGNAARPPKARAGTGRRSSRTPSATA